MRVQHINHALNPGKCFIFTDFVQCTYFELQQGNGVTANTLLSAAEGAEDSVAKFTSLVRARD